MALALALQLRFEKAHGSSLIKGPFNNVVFERDTIREKEGGPVIATHLPNGWAVDSQEFLRLDVIPRVRVTWEGFPGGPATTGELHCVDGVAYIDRRMFAVVDREHSNWYLLREGKHQRVLFIEGVR